VPRLFLTRQYSFNIKISKLQSSLYRNVSTDPLATGGEAAELIPGTTGLKVKKSLIYINTLVSYSAVNIIRLGSKEKLIS
jgi:hypothetical protein